uniref:ATP synthase complex subunit 8 n=1 Tax=Processina sexmaculata TaxID=2906307 RepID=A0A977XU34_9HEMI|nr:ATP synthase F0 subunit 8 [Processina sexmaculata]UXX17582.1 ATP synthase F0 subunit 8 [Processina sexmaculata]
MPQMSPMWWSFLMISTIILLTIMNSMIYFNIINLKPNKNKITMTSKNWKW